MWMWHHIPPVVLDFGFGTLKLDWRGAKKQEDVSFCCKVPVMKEICVMICWCSSRAFMGFLGGRRCDVEKLSSPVIWFLAAPPFAVCHNGGERDDSNGQMDVSWWNWYESCKKTAAYTHNYTMMVCLLQRSWSWCRTRGNHDHNIFKVPPWRHDINSPMYWYDSSKVFIYDVLPERNYRTDFPQANNILKQYFAGRTMKMISIFQLCCPDRF